MYITHPRFQPGLGTYGQAAAQPAALTCPADLPIDARTALLFSDSAPLATTGPRGCDKKAIWTFIPTQRPAALSVFIYLHGNNNAVPVDAAHPGGRSPDWAPGHTASTLRSSAGGPLIPGAPVASGPKYGLDAAAQQSPQRPVVLVPEDGVHSPTDRKAWARGAAGSLATPSQLGDMVSDCFQRLSRLRSTSGNPYLTQSDLRPIRRLFLAGHSAGGTPLAPSAVSSLALTVPTDLWLYDCTYWTQHIASYVSFCRQWKARGLLGNNAQSSRMAIFVTSDPLTTGNAAEIIARLRRPFNLLSASFPGLTYARLTRAGLQPPTPSVDIVEAMPDASVSQIETALRTSPVVFVHTGVAHDHIPLVWTPRLLNTAATP